MDKPKLGKLSEAEELRRRPLPPDYYVDAHQLPIHKDIGRSRPAKVARRRKLDIGGGQGL